MIYDRWTRTTIVPNGSQLTADSSSIWIVNCELWIVNTYVWHGLSWLTTDQQKLLFIIVNLSRTIWRIRLGLLNLFPFHLMCYDTCACMIWRVLRIDIEWEREYDKTQNRKKCSTVNQKWIVRWICALISVTERLNVTDQSS